MEIADAKNLLPLPALLNRLGIATPDRDKFNIKCPLHSEQNGQSFAAERKNGAWVWNCFGKCGCGGDEITLIEKHRSVSNDEAITIYLELAGGSGNGATAVKTKTKIRAHAQKQKAIEFDWSRDVSSLKSVARVAKERGYSPELVAELQAAGLIGSFNGHVAFPVHRDGQVAGVHYKVGDNWQYYPKGTKTSLLVIGELVPRDPVHIFESQWDGFAFMDVSGVRDGVIITRGAGNGALVGDLIRGGSTAYVWTQNDETDPKGKNAGEEWQATVCANTSEIVRRPRIPAQFKDLNDWTRAGATADDLVDAIRNAEVVQEAQPPLIQFKSPLELKNFTPPPGLVLVGDYHIVKGGVFVEGGPPGVGKSRGADGLAVAGATGSDWFGLIVHRRFKTMIVQTENGEFRLAREFAELDCEALEDYVRICTPPPYGLCLKRSDFRSQLSAAVSEFRPDIVIVDPWNAVAREQDSKEYLDTFDLLRSVLPPGDDAPAIGIVAHTRKPKSDERHSGRSLLNLLAGSYVLGSVPRTVFILQAASDDVNDNRVVWTCCKNNDGELGDRSAWERRNGLFAPVEFFDWDAFDHPPKEKKGLKPEVCREFLMRGREYDKAQIVSIIMKETGRGKTVAYDLVDEAKRCGVLRYHKLTKIYELV